MCIRISIISVIDAAPQVFSCNRAVEQLRGDLGYLVDKADDLRVLRNDFEERTSQIEKGAAARASEGEKTQEWYQGRLKLSQKCLAFVVLMCVFGLPFVSL